MSSSAAGTSAESATQKASKPKKRLSALLSELLPTTVKGNNSKGAKPTSTEAAKSDGTNVCSSTATVVDSQGTKKRSLPYKVGVLSKLFYNRLQTRTEAGKSRKKFSSWLTSSDDEVRA